MISMGWVLFSFTGYAEQDGPPSEISIESTAWEKLAIDKSTSYLALRNQHRRLFAAWNKLEGGRNTSGMLGQLSWANRELIGAMVRAQRFGEAAEAMRAHVDFCEKEGAGLFGRHRPNWIGFAQLHARVWAESGKDPLKGRNLTYQLEEDPLGYHAFALGETYNGERSAEVDQITWPTFPANETSGECILMDHLGRLTSWEAVGFEYPSNESLRSRLRSRYQHTEEGGAGLLRLPVAGLLEQPRKLPR